MKKNITIAATAAFLILAIAAMAVAGQGYGQGQGRGMYKNGNSAISQLTPEKQAAVDAIYEKYTPKFTELRNQMLTKHSTLQAMVNGGQADEKKIGQLTTDISDLRDKMIDLREQMGDELEKETGLVAFGRGQGRGCGGSGYQARGCGGQGRGNCPGIVTQ